jgi:ABC-type multidrug transport system fused ATPase/permease subunit
MSFFDTTPLGRILNRFSVDAQKIDVQLASSGSQFVGYIVSLLCTILIISLVSPFVLIALPPLAFFYVLYASYYRNTAREVQRLDSISKSPIYTAFTEALNGATSIQAYGANERFASVNRAKVDFKCGRCSEHDAAARFAHPRPGRLAQLIAACSLLGRAVSAPSTCRSRQIAGSPCAWSSSATCWWRRQQYLR